MDIRYYLVKNGTDTAAKAPYTIRVVPNGVANLNDLVSEILTRISSSEQRVRMTLAEATKVMLKHVLAGETVDFGGIRFKAQIPGSMNYEDSPFTPGADEVIVCAYADDELRDTFDGIVPVRLSAEEVAASIRVSNIMDVETERFGEIRGTAPFKVLGNGITLDGEGESAKLLDRKTGEVLATAGVTTVSKGQRATCAFAAVPGGIAKGAYVIEVTTFGLVGETTPRVFRKPVTLVEAIPEPVPKRVIEVSGFTANANGGETIVNFDLANAADLAGYEPQDEGAKARATFKVDGESLGEVDIYGNPFNAWHAVLPANYAGKTLEMTLTPDPAKADEVDQTPVVESATVGGEPAPEKRHVGLRDLYAYGVGESDTTVLMFGVDNAEDITGFLHGESMDSANATFKVDGEPVDGNVIEGKDGSWHATLDRNYLGKTIELTVTPDPAKADEVDQTPVSLSATVVEG